MNMALKTSPAAAGTAPPGEYMNAAQRAYFRQKLLDWRGSILNDAQSRLVQQLDYAALDQPDRYDHTTRSVINRLQLAYRNKIRNSNFLLLLLIKYN